MTFRKIANIQLINLGTGEFSSGIVAFNKSASKIASVYQQNSKTIDIQASLNEVADKYSISNNPNDYIYEAARAVTASVPNANADDFEKAELLRFDHKLAKAVYQTFILKPQHINHRSSNPKTARGVVLDATYNDLTPPKDSCPSCNNHTASIDGRDKSGINCIKCGTTVKDEFVELLLAIDTKKDPTFADGVRTGALDSLSMGCSASWTDCSICDNRAHTVNQFCMHIRGGNKKKMFKTASGMKMSYEKCGGVVFDEISRVDEPADPTAKQREVFQPMSFQAESEALIRAATINKIAQTDGLDKALEALEKIKDSHPEEYRLLHNQLDPGALNEQVPGDASIGDYVNKYEENSNKPMSTEEMGIKLDVGGIPPSVANKLASEAISSEINNLLLSLEENKVVNTLKFAGSYQDLEVSVTPHGNVKVFTPKGTLFMIRPDAKPTDSVSAAKVANEVINYIAENGLVDTAIKYNAILTPKTAQVLDFHVEDFMDGREEGAKKSPTADGIRDHDMPENAEESLTANGENVDAQDGHPKSDMDDSVIEDGERDHDMPENGAESLLKDPENDMADKKLKNKSPGGDSVLDNSDFDLKDKQPNKKAEKSAQLKQEKFDISDDEMGDFGKSLDKALPSDFKDDEGKPPEHFAPKSDVHCANEMCSMSAGKDSSGECKCPPDCNCSTSGCACAGCAEDKHAQAPMVAPPAAPMPPMAMSGALDPMVKEAAKKYTSRMERLYQGRLAKIKEDTSAMIASQEEKVTSKVTSKFLRAVKLAARRQALNLEFSPLKAKFADVLMTESNLDADSYYPGMDAGTASHIIEAATTSGLDEFVESLVKRATNFMSMNDEALSAIEADVKNLQPMSVELPSQPVKAAAKLDLRQAAIDGNLAVAPSPSIETISDERSRNNIRSALGSTKVNRTNQVIAGKK